MPGVESASFINSGDWQAASAGSTEYPGSGASASETAAGDPVEGSFEQLLQATFQTASTGTGDGLSGDSMASASRTPLQSGIWSALGGLPNLSNTASANSAYQANREQSSGHSPAASSSAAVHHTDEVAAQRPPGGRGSSSHRTPHASAAAANGADPSSANPTLNPATLDSSAAAAAQNLAAKASALSASAGGFNSAHNPAAPKGAPNPPAAGTAGDLAFAMRISPGVSDKTGAASGTGSQSTSSGADVPLQTPAAPADPGPGVSSLAAKLSESAPPAPLTGGRNETAFYMPVSSQTDRASSGPAAAEPSAPTPVTGIETLDEEPAGSNALVRSVRLQLSGENDERVDMRLVDQGGSLALSVRSSDSTLTRALQDRLPELNDRLAEQHYQSEVYFPQGAGEAASQGRPPTDARDSDSNQSGSPQSDSQQSGSQHADSRHAGSGGNGQSSDAGSQSGNAGQQQQRQNTAPAWYQQLTAFGDEVRPWTLQA